MGIKESYTSASIFPTKLLHTDVIKDRKIIPVHIQLSPTNACNLHCSFCSCNDVDRSKSLSYQQMTEVLETSALYGCKAATITGGGEPLLHPRINDVLRYAGAQGIETGLVTNGVLLDRLEEQDSLTWARISCSDERVHDYKTLNNAVQLNANTDWAFSYVVSKKPYYKNIEGVINFANDHNFSHVRLVSDMFDLENVPDMDHIKDKLKVDTSKVIFQGRKDSTRGQKNCYISLLKPVIAPEGIFPCCGAQYAVHGQKKALVDDMKMGEVDDLEKILQTQVPFNGEKCDVCYYSQYNDALAKMLSKPEHGAFV